jgi:hypothetical protein
MTTSGNNNLAAPSGTAETTNLQPTPSRQGFDEAENLCPSASAPRLVQGRGTLHSGGAA